MRGAPGDGVREVHRNCHVLISNTAAATVVLATHAIEQRQAA